MTASACGLLSLKPIVTLPLWVPYPAKILSPTRKWGVPHVGVSFVSGSARQIPRTFARTGSDRFMAVEPTASGAMIRAMLDWTRVEALSFDCFGTLVDWE